MKVTDAHMLVGTDIEVLSSGGKLVTSARTQNSQKHSVKIIRNGNNELL